MKHKRLLLVCSGAIALLLGGFMGMELPSVFRTPVPAAGKSEDAVRAFAAFLESAPRETIERLGRRAEEREGSAVREVASLSSSEALRLDAALRDVAEVEKGIQMYYPDSESGVQIRRYVALTLAQVDFDSVPELSRAHAEAALLKNPLLAARELQAVLNAIPAESEEERTVLLLLTRPVGASPDAFPIIESVLSAEIQRRMGSSASPELAETRISQLTDSYFVLVPSISKQIRFVQAGLSAQSDPQVSRMLNERLESLQSLDSSEQVAGGQ